MKALRMSAHGTRLALLVLTALPAGGFAAAEAPLGATAFLPSPQRPFGWRGDGTGVFPGATPVTEWDAASGKNIVWKLSLGFGHGSPIVVGDKVFATADPDTLLCINAADGSVAWKQALGLAPVGGKAWSKAYGAAFPTPASDGRFVYAKFSTGGLACYDMSGKQVWKAKIKTTGGSDGCPSPVLVDGKVIYREGGKGGAVVVALDAATGAEAWRCAGVDGGAWSVPNPVRLTAGGVTLIVFPSGAAIRASDGKLLYKDLGQAIQKPYKPYPLYDSAPVAGDVTVFGKDFWVKGVGHQEVFITAYRFTRKGDEVEAVKLWDSEPGFFPGWYGMLLHNGQLYSVCQGCRALTMVDMQTGKAVERKGFFNAAKGEDGYPAPVASATHLFQGSGAGNVYVVELGAEPKLVATNKLEKQHSTPYLHGSRIYIRGEQNLYCVGTK